MPVVCPRCGGSGVINDNQGLFSLSSPCPECGGRGTKIVDPCPTCFGTGRERKDRAVKVRIPGGVDDGQRIRVKARGEPGRNGGPAGDLYVVVRVTPHPLFGRKGLNLTLTVPVTFSEAALGADITVPSLDKPVTLKVPAGTKTGKTFRVRGPRPAPGRQARRPARHGRDRRADGVVRRAASGARGIRHRDDEFAASALRSVTMAERRSDADSTRAVYVISVAAELAGVHPQTLRIYERKGLLDPARTTGGTRRYSDADIARLRQIQELTNAGVNLEGVRRILALEEAELAASRARASGRRPQPSRR